MKNYCKYVLSILSIAALFSCQKEVLKEADADAASPRTITLTCSFADTKVSIDGAGKTAWEVGDQIYVHGFNGPNKGGKVITLTAGDIKSGGKIATLTFTDEEVPAYDRDDYISSRYASYPADALLGANEYYFYSIFKDTNKPLMIGYDDGAGHMIFHNLSAVLSFKVSGDFDSYIFSGNNSEGVGYSQIAAKAAIKSNSSVDFRPIYTGTDLSWQAGVGNSDPLTSISAPLTSKDGTGDNFIYIYNGANFTDGFTIKFLKGGDIVKTISTHSAVNLARNSYKPLGDITSYLRDPAAIGDVASSINASTDLSATESANCYLLESAVASTKFKFKAVKGNSSLSVGTIASVEVLWETCNGESAVSAGDVIAAADFSRSGEEQYIHFQLPATVKYGNALIAAKNAGGVILWSWHIWIPSTTIATVGGVTTYPLMDRNLGALSVTNAGPNPTVESYGLLYQWGRKDPFPGIKSTSSSSSFIVMTHSTTQTAGPATSSDLVQNPTVFYTTSNSEDYLDVSDAARWGEGAGKTVNDPCPAGYRVPAYDQNDLLWTALTAEDYTSFGYNLSDRWFKLDKAIFPICGAYSYGGYFSYLGERTIIWSNKYQNWESTPHLGISHIFKVGVGGDSVWGSQKAMGATVRCARDGSPVATTEDEEPVGIAPEVKNGDVILVTNDKVEKFITEVTYPEKNYLVTHILDDDYAPTAPGNSDKPKKFTIRWEANPGAGTPVAHLWEDDGWTRTFTNLTTEDTYVTITNLRPNANYHYEVTAGATVLTSGAFQTTGHVHQVYFSSEVRNARDLGGWPTKSGKKVKYRKIYRGGRMQPSTLTDEGKADVMAEGIRAQLDLRGTSDVLAASPFGAEFDFCAPVIEEGYVTLLQNDGAKAKQCIEFIMDCVHNGKPVYYHCSLGRDRTGTITMLILGLLGVDEGTISKEYELTQFAPQGWATSTGESTKMTRKVDYKGAANYIWNLAGEGSFADGVEAYLLSLGISQASIDEFRSSMLED